MRAYNLFMPLRNGPWRGVLSRCHQAPPSLPHSVHSYLNTDHQHLISTLISSCIKAHTSPKLIVWSTSWCTDHLPADLCDSLLQLLTVFSLCLQCPPSCIYSSKSILQNCVHSSKSTISLSICKNSKPLHSPILHCFINT